MTVTQEPGQQATRAATRPPAPPLRVWGAEPYISKDYLDLEFKKMWSKVWQLACLDSDIPNVGDHYVYEIGFKSILVVRESEDSIRAYHNVCLHRGRKIKEGAGNSVDIRCPYHGWTWNHDGSLKDVPEREEFCPINDQDFALRAVKVEVWNHWVFINLDPNCGPLDDYLGEIKDKLAPYRFDRQYKWWSRSTVVRTNWKAGVDAFNEAYHARYLHPESVAFINYVGYGVGLVGDHSTMYIPFGEVDELSAAKLTPDWEDSLDAMEFSLAAFGEDTTMVSALRGIEPPPGTTIRSLVKPQLRPQMEAANIDVSGLTDDQLLDDYHVLIFPNIILNVFSFGYWLFRPRPHPADPDYSIWDLWYHHRVPDNMELPPPDPNQSIPEGETCGPVMDQDFRNLPHQQDGLKTGEFPGAALASYEARIDHMHRVNERYLRAE